MHSQIDKEKIRKRLSEIQKIIQTEADPELLNEYRALIRKEISFFNRSYLAAYLLMLSEQGGRDYSQGTRKRRSDHPAHGNSGSASDAQEQNRYPLPEEEATRLFISVGRNRRVFPREILGLINSKTSVSKDDIGSIKIFDNYSFVQVRTAAAGEIIDALNGKQFRGRTLTVNYARNRKEEGNEAPELHDENMEDGPVSAETEQA
ncbi:DbpA RNA binding domain-containing protein [Treponema sp. OttesenSCG-928-L16]|nr:DbpA RNA binding domain-containing protein [Treponema sp. OttesenSCG-928-L16]